MSFFISQVEVAAHLVKGGYFATHQMRFDALGTRFGTELGSVDFKIVDAILMNDARLTACLP